MFFLVDMKLYGYKNCSTCKKAEKWLTERGISFEKIPIREIPPTKDEIYKMIKKYGVKKVFNTSGKDYRKLGIKDKLATMSENEIVVLLSSNGNLVKRPFLVAKTFLIGFKEEEWQVLC